jgi:hypothetical protein
MKNETLRMKKYEIPEKRIMTPNATLTLCPMATQGQRLKQNFNHSSIWYAF